MYIYIYIYIYRRWYEALFLVLKYINDLKIIYIYIIIFLLYHIYKLYIYIYDLKLCEIPMIYPPKTLEIKVFLYRAVTLNVSKSHSIVEKDLKF